MIQTAILSEKEALTESMVLLQTSLPGQGIAEGLTGNQVGYMRNNNNNDFTDREVEHQKKSVFAKMLS
jgi:hypothetical protein